MQESAFLGAGEVYIDRLTSAGVSTGYTEIGNAMQFELTPDAEMKELQSRNPKNYGQTVASVALAKPTKVKLKFTDFNATALEMALMGTTQKINQPAGAVSKTVSAVEGKWVEIGARNLSASGLEVKKDGSTTAFKLGEDYEVNYALGMIKALPSGAIVSGDVLKVTGTSQAYTGQLVSVGAETIIKADIKLDGKNLVDGRKVIVHAKGCTFKPASSIDMLKNEFGEIELEGTVGTSQVEWLD